MPNPDVPPCCGDLANLYFEAFLSGLCFSRVSRTLWLWQQEGDKEILAFLGRFSLLACEKGKEGKILGVTEGAEKSHVFQCFQCMQAHK